MNNKFILIGAISVLVVALVAGLVVVGIGEMSLKDPESTSASQESTLAESTATKESSTAGETTDATKNSTAGTTENETTATEETVPGESTQGGNSGTKPTKPDSTEGDDGYGEHKPGSSTEDTTKPTKKPEPTDPPKPPVIEEGKNPTFNGKTLDEFTYVDYVNMEVTVEQPAFITWATEQLGSRQAFKQWYLKVQKEYNDSQTTVVIGGGNSIDLGDLINQQNKK